MRPKVALIGVGGREKREENGENINVDVGESGRAKRGGQSSK